jgi:outer membrane biosynthesis protein TonB
LQPNSSLLSSLLTRFRVSYPTGSLIAEFLTVHEGNYAVRALVLVGGSTLASGMAAHANIEIAEDQAKTRALEALGMTSAFLPTPSFPPNPLPQWTAEPLPQPLSQPNPPKLPEKADQPDKPIEQPISSQPEAAELLPAETPPAEQLEPTPAVDKAAKSKKGKLEEVPAPLEGTQDRSDEIARIGVEMKRLGWTTIQGRDYLKQRYGKRSRQELNDPELLDFLAYLESQPAPAP